MQAASVARKSLLVSGALVVGGAFLIVGGRDAAASHGCDPMFPDDDADGLPLSCDPGDFSPDIDLDGFEDSIEVYVGTDASVNCSFPLDIDNNGRVDILDVLLMDPVILSSADSPEYRARFDFNADESINTVDVLTFRYSILFHCPYPTHPSNAIAVLEWGTAHLDLAQVWYSNVGNMYVENDALVPGLPTCGEVKRAADHWSNLTDFTFSVGLTGNCATTSDPRVMVTWNSALPRSVAAQTVPWWTFSPLHECTADDPCHFADFAYIYLNPDYEDEDMVGDETFRHVVLVHELGHVLGQGHTGFFPACQPNVPYTIMYLPGFCWDFWDPLFHWVRVNDALFTNVKY